MKHQRFSILLPSLCVCLVALTFADEPQQLKDLRFDFQGQLAEMIKPLRDFDKKYAEHLEKQKQGFKNSGKLEAMLAVEEELKWLKAKPIEDNPSQGHGLSSVPDLKRLQGIYRQQWTTLETEFASPEKKLTLIQTYRKKAGDLASGWTKAGMIDEAKLALAESKRFAEMEKDAELAGKAGRTVASGPAMRMGNDFAGRKAGDEMKNGIKMKLCWIPAGKFAMGRERVGNEAQVEVDLTLGFWMGKYEVTQEEYEKIAGTNPAKFKEVGDDAPVEQVSYGEAVVFCEKLTEREQKRGKLPEGWAYTLPTEAQWEYAERAGEKGPYSGGKLDEVGWYRDNSGGKTHEVGEKKANAWGLHDVRGNVQEWCLDWYVGKLLGGKDPMGPTSGLYRVRRGGSAGPPIADFGAPTGRNSFVGFRVCLSPTSN